MGCCPSTSPPSERWLRCSAPTRRSSSSRSSAGCSSTSRLKARTSKPPSNHVSKLPGLTPFPPEFAELYRARGYWEDIPLGRFYSEVFASQGDRLALVSGNERVTYPQLKQRVDRLALHLLGLGVAPLDRW